MSVLIKKARDFLAEIKDILSEKTSRQKMTGNAYFMKDGSVLCMERKNGESRFPYANDGYILWAHSTGHIQVKSGIFNVFKPVYDSNDVSVEFFAGIQAADGTYFPVSLLGSAKQLFEPFQVERYLVYTLSAAYYITETDFATFVLRVSMSKRQELQFSFACANKTEKPLDMYLTSYFEPFMKSGEFDSIWEPSTRRCIALGDGKFTAWRGEGGPKLGVKRQLMGIQPQSVDATTVKEVFLGSARGYLSSAQALKTGKFEKEHVLSYAGEIVSEMIAFSLQKESRIDYVLPLDMQGDKIEELLVESIDARGIDEELEELENEEKNTYDALNIELDGFKDEKINAFLLNNFTKKVQKQVNNCAMGRYYVEDLMGIRDVYQQLEQALIWNPKQARSQMLTALSFITPYGRAPRQYSLPYHKGESPKMDWREFIDQGNWIISCFYSYLSWTGDWSILDEEIGYSEQQTNGETVLYEDRNDSVLCHLLKITEYLIGNIDREEGTHCLKILFGDWNDAMDGLGRTKDEGKTFGTGVSIMASLHFYQNLFEMTEILKKLEVMEEKIAEYSSAREELKQGILQNAIQINEKGDKRLIHGWGDHRSYQIGSFCDSDGESRISFAPNAFWVTSGLIEETPELKELIINNLNSLKSKFGLKTLIPAFTAKTPGVGRIANIIEGTAENECTYVHATMFSVMALFGLGASENAWQEFYKVLPLAHEQITKTPFVMSNSYCDNPDYGYFGQSVVDWYTGSGTVYIKNLVRELIGIQPNLEGVTVQTANKLPCASIRMECSIKGKNFIFQYKNTGANSRKIYFNDQVLETDYDVLRETQKTFVSQTMFVERNVIEVVD